MGLRMKGVWRVVLTGTIVPVLLVQSGLGWGNEGHRMINRLAAAKLPADVPEFLRSPYAQDAMEYYGPEPDRWKSSAEAELRNAGSPEHYIDLEWADLIGEPLPRNRYDFVRALALAQKAHPDLPLSPEKVGLQPWAADEWYQRVKAAMREYRGLKEAHQDTRPVEAEILFCAGILGHFVADASNPLHDTIQFNGWTGPNPNGYTTGHHIHAQMESDFVAANVDPVKDVAPLIPAQPHLLNDFFDDYVAYIRRSNALVEQTYQIEKAGGFTGAGTAASRAFIDQRLAAGATELRDVIDTAWVRSGDPVPQYHPQPPAPAGK
jgi:hypothetical protein